MKKKIVIVGGSIAGLTSALILASAKNDSLDFDITIIDSNKADLKAVAIYNSPLFPKAIQGSQIISKTKEQINDLLKVSYIDGEIKSISGNKANFKLSGNKANNEALSLDAEYIILATGASSFEITGLGDVVEPHTLMNKPNKIKLKTTGRQVVKDGIYAAGLASGVTSMVTTAIGSASEAACAILSDIKGEVAIVHDTPTSRK